MDSRCTARSTSRPTEPQIVVLGELERDTEQLLGDLNDLISTTIGDINKMLGSYPKIMLKSPETE